MLQKNQVLAISLLSNLNKKQCIKVALSSHIPTESHDAKQLYQILKDFFPSLEFLKVKVALNHANALIQFSRKKGIEILPINDPQYPAKLLTIENPPIVLFVKGNINLLNSQKNIAVIGTRTPSDFGVKATQLVSTYLAQNHITVISGLAIGCDTIAHQSCIKAEGKTIVVLAHGLDMIYPTLNIQLSQSILDQGGCLISEYLPGIKPEKFRFIERNRIQSGLSDGVIVIESDVKGGTMHTVQHAIKQQKKLACIIPNPENQTFKRGYCELIQQNSFVLEIGEDDFATTLTNFVNMIYHPPLQQPLNILRHYKRKFFESHEADHPSSSKKLKHDFSDKVSSQNLLSSSRMI